jgi:AbiJ N-terminal domain 4
MELSFSQRTGLKPVKSLIQVNSMDEDLRNALWNDVTLQIWYSTSTNAIDDFLRTIWMHYFKRLIDLVPGTTNELKKEVKGSFFQFKWYEVYDFIEFVANNFPDEYAIDKFLIACNTSLQ